MVGEFITEYKLNADQAAALRGVASMFETETGAAPSITLVHGA